MWTYISEVSEKEHRCVTKEEAIKALYPNDLDDLFHHTNCYLCYYSDKIECGCDGCPVKWDGYDYGQRGCGGRSCFSKWVDAKVDGDYTKASKYAAKIATLPLKEKESRLIINYPDTIGFYGNVGEVTLMKDEDGEVLHVGDVVEIRLNGYRATQVVVHPINDYPFIMGIYGACRKDGSINREWSVKLLRSYKELKAGDKVCALDVAEQKMCIKRTSIS